jgi:DNA-binding MarR family transcriptional regulator
MDQRTTAIRQPLSLGEIGLQQFAPYLMNRIMGRYNASLQEELRQHGLTVAQARALAVLSVITDGVPINDLAVYTVIGQSTMSRTIDALEAQGLVRRETGEHDSRIRKVFLTEAGRVEFARAWPFLQELFETMFHGIDEAEYAAFVATLHKMLKNVRLHQL